MKRVSNLTNGLLDTLGFVHVSGHDREIELTLEAMVDFANALDDGGLDARTLLVDHGFGRARDASGAALERVAARMEGLSTFLRSLPATDAETAVATVNGELAALEIEPSLTDHDGSGLHLHWTPMSASFDDQVIADVLMAVAQELCDHGTARFGVCAATGCDHLFYDATRNASRRFCRDPRCASRTHTAEHRARHREA